MKSIRKIGGIRIMDNEDNRSSVKPVGHSLKRSYKSEILW